MAARTQASSPKDARQRWAAAHYSWTVDGSIVALGHKMLRMIYAMLSKKTHYVDKTVDCKALMVARNAPRELQILVKHGFVPTPV